MDTYKNNDILLQQGEGAQFGEYTATKSSHPAQSNFSSSLDGIQSGGESNGEYQTTTNEIAMDSEYNPSGGDILQATSEGITLGDLKRASMKGGFGTQLGTSYDVLQATSVAESGNAQFGEYKSTTTKVNGEKSQFTQSVDNKFSTGEGFDINAFQANNPVESNAQIIDQGFNLGDFNTTDSETKVNSEGFNTQFDIFQTTSSAHDTGAQFGEYQTTTSAYTQKAQSAEANLDENAFTASTPLKDRL